MRAKLTEAGERLLQESREIPEGVSLEEQAVLARREKARRRGEKLRRRDTRGRA